MSKAQRKPPPSEPTENQSTAQTVLDGLRIKSAEPKRARKTKTDGSRTWDQVHQTYRYDLTNPNVYYEVSGIATELNIPNVSSLAALMIDFSLAMFDQGQVWMESRVNPNQNSNRMVLSWQAANEWPQDVKPDFDRKKRQRKMIAPARRRPPFGFRWSALVHTRIKKIAQDYSCTQGDVVTRLLAYAIEARRQGKLKIHIQTIASADANGWEQK